MAVIDKTKLPKIKFKDIKERQSFKYAGGVYTKLPKLFNRTECNAIDNEHGVTEITDLIIASKVKG